jgi:hypothetical protein
MAGLAAINEYFFNAIQYFDALLKGVINSNKQVLN